MDGGRFHVSVGHIGYIMIFLGFGNLLGSLTLILLYILLPNLQWIWLVCFVYFGISLISNIMTPAIAERLLSLNPAFEVRLQV